MKLIFCGVLAEHPDGLLCILGTRRGQRAPSVFFQSFSAGKRDPWLSLGGDPLLDGGFLPGHGRSLTGVFVPCEGGGDGCPAAKVTTRFFLRF